MEVEPKGSILNSIKKNLGLEADYKVFDPDIILFINSTIATLRQVGFGPEEGFRVEDESQTWEDYYGDEERFSFVKDYVYCKVRLLFDPPQNSFGQEALKSQAEEALWRINFERELDLDKQ